MAVSATSAVRASDIEPIDSAEAERLSTDMTRALIDLLQTLDQDHWDLPTDCELWSVRDHLAHQVGWNEALASFKELAHQVGRAARRTKELGNIIDAQNQVQVDERRDATPDELIARLEETFERAASKRHRLTSILGPIPVYSSYMGGWINVAYLANAIFPRDILMHRIDVARATGKALRLGRSEQRIVEDIVKDWFGRTRAKVRLELQGPAGGVFTSSEEPVATIAADAIEFVRLLFGRADRSVLLITGDLSEVERALDVFFPV